MKVLSYNKEILTATGEMIRLFSNITIIQLHDKNGNGIKPINSKKILVPMLYAQTSRILKSIMNPKGAPQEYPIITLEKNNISADLGRNAEIHHDIVMNTSLPNYLPDSHPPIPVDIGFTLNIFGKYPEDVDMIVSNFASWFNMDVFVTTPHPKLSGKTLNHQVVWSGEVKYDWKSTLQPTDQDIIMASTDFTYKTEIYAGYGPIKSTPDGEIRKVVLDYSVSDGSLYPEYDPSKAGGGEGGMGNMMGGFFCVPYDADFDAYSERIVTNTISPGELDYDALSFNYFNEKFNESVMNDDLVSLESAATSGANIYLHSYWPYAYAKSQNYESIVNWLDEHNALKPTFTTETESPTSYVEHYPFPDGEKIHIADLP